MRRSLNDVYSVPLFIVYIWEEDGLTITCFIDNVDTDNVDTDTIHNSIHEMITALDTIMKVNVS